MNASLKNAIDTAQYTVTTFSASDTTLTVASATDFDVNDVLQIDAELLTVSSVSGNDVTVQRGQLATSAVSHAAATSITLIEPAGTSSTIAEGGTYSNSDTTLTVTSAAALGAGTNSYIRIDDEILQVASIAGNDLTVVRAQLGTTAAAHTDGSTVTLLTVTTNKTEIDETTATGVTAPLIKNLDTYESNVETASNNWKWGAKTAGIHGNSVRVIVTDAGPDQVLYLAQPTTAEWEFTNNAEVSFSNANIYSKVYDYSVIVTFKDDSNLVGSFEKDNYITAVSGGVTGRVVAYDKVNRKLEITIDTTSTDVLEVSDVISELANNSNTPGSATGDTGAIESITRELRVALNQASPNFQANQTVVDANAATISIANVESDYESRLYGENTKWINVAARPTTSAWVADRGGHNDLMHILVLDGDGKITGTPGAVLEKHLNVSKANDAKSPQGDNIYYKDVVKTYSSYLYWGSHETANIYDKDTVASGVLGVSGINREFDIIKAQNALNNLDDPTGLNPLAVPLLGTKNLSLIHISEPTRPY